jgi:hypothetical protein
VADEIPGFDPFRREVKLQLESVYYPLGFPLHLATNSAEIHKSAEENWGRFTQAFDKPPLRVRVSVEPGGGRSRAPAYRGQERLMVIAADGGNFAVCDHTRGSAFCWLTEGTAGDRAFTGYYFLEAMANYTLTQLYLTPVHGACVARNGRGVLLCGPSGAGKTSLAYHCARNGWTFVSDNDSWLVRESGGRLALGNPHRVRFRASARELFPEISGLEPAPDANGKMSISLAPRGIDIAYQTCVDRLVVLSRQDTAEAAVLAVRSEDVFDRLLAELPVYDRGIRREQAACLRRIAGLNPVELRYGRLEDARFRLESLFS